MIILNNLCGEIHNKSFSNEVIFHTKALVYWRKISIYAGFIHVGFIGVIWPVYALFNAYRLAVNEP